jgi:hypothetical protein
MLSFSPTTSKPALQRDPVSNGDARWGDRRMNHEELTERVRTLRATGRSPKQIARALGVPAATVAPLIRTIAAEQQAHAPEPQLVGCWVSPGWSDGLTVTGHPEWPDARTGDTGVSGLVSVLVARRARHDKVSACGWLVDAYCLGVKDTVGPRTMDQADLAAFTRSFFAAYPGPPLPAPLDLAQHLVFGAVAYAGDLGFEPARGFETTTGHLGPWAGPSAIQFGRDGRPVFVQGPHDDPNRVLAKLDHAVGPGNYDFLVVSP